MLYQTSIARLALKFMLSAAIMASSHSFAQALDHPAPSDPAMEQEEIGLSFRHIVILQADLKNIWGTYFFAVNNKADGERSFKTFLMLPRESVDFKAQDGLEDQDLKIDENGQLYMEKNFPPGVSLLGVSFQVKAAQFGNDTISFLPPFDVQELSVAVPSQSGVAVAGKQFKAGVPPMLADGRYQGMQTTDIKKGQILEVQVSGIPKDRVVLWIVGAVFTLLLAFLGVGLTLKTRDVRHAESEDQVI